jgi:predicted transcriptional regulator
MLKAGVERDKVFALEDEFDAGKITRAEYDERTSSLIDAVQTNTRRMEQEADNRRSAQKKLQALYEELEDMQLPPAKAKKNKFRRELVELGIPDIIGNLATDTLMDKYLREYDRAVEAQETILKDKQDTERGTQLHRSGLTPKEKYTEEITEANRLFQLQKISEADLFNLKKRYQKAFHDAERAERSQSLNERFREEDSVKKRLGIKDPLGDYRRDVDRLQDALTRGEISEDEFGNRKGELRKRAVDELWEGGVPSEIKPVAAMEAGSAAAHAAIVQANLPDAKLAVMNRMLAVLEHLEREVAQNNENILQ